MEHVHACCVCKKRLPDRKKRIPLFGQTGKAKDNRKGLVLSFPLQNSKTASICLGLTFSYPIFEALHELRQKALLSNIASSPYREFSLWLRHQLTFLSVSVHSRTLTNSHIGYVPDPFPSVTQRIKWSSDGWGLVYETNQRPLAAMFTAKCPPVNTYFRTRCDHMIITFNL